MVELIDKQKVLEILRNKKEIGYFDIVRRNIDEAIQEVETLEPVSLNENHADSNEPSFGPKTTYFLGQKTLPEPSLMEVALRMWENPQYSGKSLRGAIDDAVEVFEHLRQRQEQNPQLLP